jgi:lipopolysaccharide biosynthesis glycosyltransferase
VHQSLTIGSSDTFGRIPENCAHTSVSHPGGLKSPPPITGRRTYTLLNSGTVVLNPSQALMQSIESHLSTSPNVARYSFPDQDLLADVFQGKWKSLPYCYNALKTLRVIHANLWRDEEIRCLHYILPDKPWHTRVGDKEMSGEYDELHMWWWEKFDQLGTEMQRTDETGWKLLLQNVDTKPL